MHVLVTGATGFIGQGVLAEALLSPEVTRVTVLGRRASGVTHDKLTDLVVEDLADLSGVAPDLAGVDACFWCLGTSSGGLDEATYTRITHTLTMEAARRLQAQNPQVRFCFVSGSGADGKAMWGPRRHLERRDRPGDDRRGPGEAGRRHSRLGGDQRVGRAALKAAVRADPRAGR